MDKTELFICECHDVTHQLILQTCNEDKVILGSYHLDNYGFKNRINSAAKFCVFLFMLKTKVIIIVV